MANTNPTAVALGFLYATLNGDSTFTAFVAGGIWTGLAPEGTASDYCILSQQSSRSVKSGTAVKILSNALYQVKVCGPMTDEPNLESAYDRILTDLALVRNASGSYGSIIACYIEQDLYYQETVGGVAWVNLGGLFRVLL